jgi:metal-sulfur cluster biosynthetic enzyme
MDRYAYTGDPALAAPVRAALDKVVDPEMAIGVVALGLLYSVQARPGRVAIRMTMTSAACPVADVIEDDIRRALKRALGERTQVNLEIIWEPPWTPERMSDRARDALGY